MPDFIGIDVQGAKELSAKLEKMPDAVADAVVEDVADYVIKKVELYPPKKSISRKRAFPNAMAISPKGKILLGYHSWKQFKYVMALISRGKVPYRRTQTLRKGWQKIGRGRNLIIVNETGYAAYVQGYIDEQSNMMHLIGWTRIDQVIEENSERIDKIMEGTSRKTIRKLGIEVE